MNRVAGTLRVQLQKSANKVAGIWHSRRRVSPKLACQIKSRRDSTTWRSGFTLVEMLAVVATGSVLLVIGTGVVHRAMRLESQWRSQANVNRALSRLADDFRTDVHKCQDMVLAEGPPALRLTSPDGTVVTYEIAADEIIRDVQSPGADRRREFYAKPADYQAVFTIQDEPQWVELRVTHDPQLKGIEPRIVLHVEAEAGRYLRLTRESGGPP